MFPYLDNVSIEQLQSARLTGFAGVLIAMVGVVVGVALQRGTFSTSLQRRGWILLVLCLAIEPLFLALSFSIDTEISLRQHAALLKSHEQVVNRTLSRAEKERVSGSLALFAGQTVETIEFPVSFENDRIASEVQALLNNALWIAAPVSRISIPPRGALVQGIRVSATADDQSQAAAGYLVGLLNDTVSVASFDPSPLPGPDSPRVRIYVGDKPASLVNWLAP